MKKWAYFGVAVLVSACGTAPQAPLVTDADGQTVIQINTSGLTCYNSGCLEINPAGSVRAVGYKRTRIPSGINVSDGTVTPEEFRRLREAAMLAGGVGSGSDR
ncbi:hypothetical protein [Ruegeria arenilitoris]|uniref:hypothetical protein n=1 Tax=Ruegeria arenilitoris TaxID=1173585 RepID=UPI00147F4604|nr:hypothetical protein [Ruegeria arenilitoris]